MTIVYFLFRIIARLISYLPFPLLYALSDILYLKLYYVIRYRKRVVYTNLRNSFPEKSDQEIRKIARNFYRHLADVILEIIKLRSMSGDQLVSRLHFNNLSVINDLHASGQSILVGIGHIGNWEWMPIGLQRFHPVKGFAVYKPLSDKFFDRYYHKIRSRLLVHSNIIPFKQIFRVLLKCRNEMTFTVLASDQTPHRDEINYWTQFLNQETAFFLGLEKMAISLNMAVVFMDAQRIRRGHYEVNVTKITDAPGENEPFEITERYVHLLEETIRKNPYNWLWSHRRWKYKREEKGERREERGIED
ncbi:MAG: lysophospholipid acyltransferase family protein [Bacteroidales bacterium]|nr:lysophospholipid acyltransferase family protein [Lentimicrobiaceae bacterium]MDD5695413.1 lysophospholipid acyltransferase family protein [Bacteroidales bacterium]